MFLRAAGVVAAARGGVSAGALRRAATAASAPPDSSKLPPAGSPGPSKPCGHGLEISSGVPCFEIVNIAGAGLGAIATRDIACGELVVAETPTMMLQAGEFSVQTAKFNAQFNNLSRAQKRAVLRLSDCWRMAGKRRSLEGILRTNGMGCSSDSDDGVLCLEISRFNHSCAPNCEQSWDGTALQERVHACSAIQAGQELCLSYIDVRAPRAERAHRLREGYRFNCRCAACSETACSRASDARRASLQQLGRDLPMVGARDPAAGIKVVSDMLLLYDQEGIDLHTLRKQACYYAFQLALHAGPAAWASGWAEQAYRHSRLCCGEHHPETVWLLGYARDPHSHPALWTPAFEVCNPGKHRSAMDPALKVYALAWISAISLVLSMGMVSERSTVHVRDARLKAD
ncbi:unnamed protein product [Prorocentrum cordatum]|uniref:SET domain-containing protein n=1 Tax=Prorocentrum cordatum TaxID=2364126 RepID=A0ABN9RNT6_9DINO|nr:unnamed protein product [Polarella glacialis]